MIKLTIDNMPVEIEEGSTVLDAARKINVDIPTLCHLKDINEIGACRMCIVEVEGARGFVTSCVQRVSEGMVVRTNTPAIREARKVTLDLILSNHNRECLTCARNQNCELQSVSEKLNMKEIEYDGQRVEKVIDDFSPSIVRDPNKCILCKRCVSVCKNVQQIGAIDIGNRGFEAQVVTAADKSLNDVNCTMCGQCITACPTGALQEKDSTKEVWEKIKDPDIHVVVQTAPAVRVAIGEEFGMEIGKNVTGKMVAALKQVGFDKVFDTDTAADFTIMEEGTELIERIKNNGTLPMITSCSPGWVKFAEMNYPDLVGHLSTAKSPHEMFGAILKSYYAEKTGIDPKKIYVVSVMPCVAKKFERQREELINDVDAVITTREAAKMIKEANVDFVNIKEETFDDPMGEATGAAVIFGTTGGVMEAALRTVYEVLTEKELDKIDFVDVRGEEGIKKATVKIGDKEVKVVVAHGLANATKIMEEIKEKKADYQFVEIMACPGGCVTGGGQPIKSAKTRATVDVRALRAQGLYSADKEAKLRKSHENPVVKKVYEEFLEKPGSHKSHELLHTHYTKREKYNL